jgi:pectinesterase
MRTRAALPLLLVAAALAAPMAAQTPARVTVRAENPLPQARADEIVAMPWAAVRRQLPAAAADRVRVLDAAGRELPSQVVDNDGDGTEDELLVQTDFSAREVKPLTVEAAAPTQKPVARVDARYDPPRDDMAWESDRIAFRIYGQGLWKNAEYEPLHSSGIDVWPKRTRALIVEKWYAKGHDAYHVDKGEGADFYDVGPTLGSGGTAVWARDTLWRAENFRSWKIIADGPIRASSSCATIRGPPTAGRSRRSSASPSTPGRTSTARRASSRPTGRRRSRTRSAS